MTDTDATARLDVTIPGPEGALAAWWWRPGPSGAAVVMAHGFSGLKEHDLDRYAEVFAAGGLGVALFDHPGFGASEGEPRLEVSAPRQLAAYRAAIDWTAAQPGVDPNRIGVWGSSFSGGHVFTLAGTDSRIGAAVAQAPYAEPPTRQVPAPLRAMIDADPEGTMPVTAPGDPAGQAVMASPGAHDYFNVEYAPRWENRVRLTSLRSFFEYAPIDHAAGITCPLLAVCADSDVLTPTEPVRRVLAAAAGPTALVEVPGGHFDVYRSSFAASSGAARDWFVTHLTA